MLVYQRVYVSDDPNHPPNLASITVQSSCQLKGRNAWPAQLRRKPRGPGKRKDASPENQIALFELKTRMFYTILPFNPCKPAHEPL